MKTFVLIVISCILQSTGGSISGAMPVFDVTLEYFSGIPNPKWKLDKNNPKYTEINQLYISAEKNKQLFTLINMPSVLGYRGFVLNDERGTDVLVVGQKTVQLQKLLLQSAPKGKLTNILLGKLTKAIENGPKPVLAQRGRRAVNYRPDDWNKEEKVLKCNNCYNYATGKPVIPKQKFGVPGLGGGQEFARPITKNGIRDAAVRDKLIVTANPGPGVFPVIPAEQQADRHLVALVVAEDSAPNAYDGDFHWYRLDSDNNGRWSHKPGETEVTTLVGDGTDTQVTDPRTPVNVTQGPNYKFVTFMTVPKSVVTIKGYPNNDC